MYACTQSRIKETNSTHSRIKEKFNDLPKIVSSCKGIMIRKLNKNSEVYIHTHTHTHTHTNTHIQT